MGSILPHAPGSPRGTFSRETPLDDGAPRASPSLPPTTARGSDPRELTAAHRGERVDLEDLVRDDVPREAFAPGHSLTREGEIGRASCRERVEILVVAGSLRKIASVYSQRMPGE